MSIYRFSRAAENLDSCCDDNIMMRLLSFKEMKVLFLRLFLPIRTRQNRDIKREVLLRSLALSLSLSAFLFSVSTFLFLSFTIPFPTGKYRPVFVRDYHQERKERVAREHRAEATFSSK